MGIFGDSRNAFDGMIEKVTDEKNTAEDWGEIMSVCDRVGATKDGPKECLKALMRRLNNPDPHVVLQAIIVLDACVNNCGRHFLLEVASREFETEFKRLLGKSHPKVVEKLKTMLKGWAQGEFSKDAAYSLIPALYASLRKEGMDFSSEEERVKKSKVPADPMAVASQQEEEDIAKAIQLSLQESKTGGSKKSGGGSGVSSVLYPSDSLFSGGSSSSAPAASSSSGASVRKEEEKKARALYDFEAAEDNELTFKAGEIVIILDDADPNWWKGSNHRGEGLFPSNFVSMDMSSSSGAEGKKKGGQVMFSEEVQVKEVEQVTWPQQTIIDEQKIDSLLGMLHDADPTSGDQDHPDMARLEEQVSSMGPMIDTELEKVDRRHAQLTRLSHQLVDALTLYHTLMRDMPAVPSYPGMYQQQPQPGLYNLPPQQQQQQAPGMGQVPPMSVAGGMQPPPMGAMPGVDPNQPQHMNMAPGPMPPHGHPQGQPMYAPDPYMYQPQPGAPGAGYMMPGSAPPPTPPLQDHQLSVHQNQQQNI